MGMGWIVVAVAGVAAYVGYRKLQGIEKDLRRELAEEAQKRAEARESPPAEAPAAGQRDQPQAIPPAPPGEEPDALRTSILGHVKARPGLLQTELYSLLADIPRRRLQSELRDMAEEGVLKRQRDGGSYRLELP